MAFRSYHPLADHARALRAFDDGAQGIPPPLFVLPTGGGLAYAAFTIDVLTRNYLLRQSKNSPTP